MWCIDHKMVLVVGNSVAADNVKAAVGFVVVSVVANTIDFRKTDKTEHHMLLEHYNVDTEIAASQPPHCYIKACMLFPIIHLAKTIWNTIGQ